MKTLLTASAMIELGAGLGLLIAPSLACPLLVGVPLDLPAAVLLTRIGGAGLCALGMACWFVRQGAPDAAAKGMVVAMTFYNVVAAGLLADAGIRSGLYGIALWPGVALHTVMSICCVSELRPRSRG